MFVDSPESPGFFQYICHFGLILNKTPSLNEFLLLISFVSIISLVSTGCGKLLERELRERRKKIIKIDDFNINCIQLLFLSILKYSILFILNKNSYISNKEVK